METKVLGNSDLRITPIGSGAWAIGGDWEFGWGAQDDAQSIAAIHRALELGVNWIDTAAVSGLPKTDWRTRNDQFKEPKLSENLQLVERLRAVGTRHVALRVKSP